jgi:hypothetical protein
MSDAKRRMVQVVLHWAWDPIGIRTGENAAHEYDAYAASVLTLLERRAPAQEIAAYLGGVEGGRMGLKPHPSKNEDVAGLLIELHSVLP